MTDAARSRLNASALSKFEYRIESTDGAPRARIRMPTWPSMPRGSGLRFGGRDAVEIEADGATHRLEYETFDHGVLRAPGYRYFLMAGERTLATATREARGARDWRVVAGDATWTLRDASSAFRLRFRLLDDGRHAGAIEETTRLLRLRRRFALDLPGAAGLPVQAFLLFLAVNQRFR